MIGSLFGIPTIISQDTLLIEVNGVGYRVILPPRIVSTIKSATPLRLWIHTHVREDVLDLFGFSMKEELDFFKVLLTISGIGPKTALSILSQDLTAIKKAIVSGDAEFFSVIPRLGKKNAQRIIIELRPKLGSLGELDLIGERGGETKDALDALVAMGFSKREAVDALGKVTEKAKTIEQKVKEALKLIGKS